jgi:hypothetical protein
MRAAMIIAPFSVLVFVVMLSVGTACGTGYRNGGGFGGCAKEVGRQYQVLTGTNVNPDSPGSFRDVGRASGSGQPDRALVAGGSSASGQARWRQVSFWTGRGNKDTELFLVARPEWRVTWSAKRGSGTGAEGLRISVYDNAKQSTAVLVDSDRPGDDTAYLTSGAGSYRLKIESTNVDWYVQVEEP